MNKLLAVVRLKQMLILIGLVMSLFLSGCAKPIEDIEIRSTANLAPHGEREGYFPAGIFNDEREDLDNFTREWYGNELDLLDEPSLYELSNDESKTAYRFLYLRSFHPAIAIRIELEEDKTGKLYVKNGDEYKQSSLSTIKTGQIFEELDRSILWKLSSTIEYSGLDGAHWIIEAVENGQYHLVDRWAPKYGYIRRIGLYFLEVGGVDLDKEELY